MKVELLSKTLVCFVAISVGVAQAAPEADGGKSSVLAKRYHRARTQFERRIVCIEAIDEGLIGFGKDVHILKDIFGYPLNFEKLKQGEFSSAVVFFNMEQIMRESKPDSAAALSGWYFFCTYNSKMQIEKYYITDAPFNST